MNLCVNCKHCTSPLGAYRCEAPQNSCGNLVDGSYTARWTFCETHRNSDLIDSFILKMCGKRGRWFEPKEQ